MTVDSGAETRHRRIFGVEQHHIDPIPASERHGKPRSLFFVWFAANLVIGTIITGALAVLVGNDLFWAVVSIVIGNLVGAVFMAFHSAQGPRLGVPQLIQSRGQFGFYGAILPVILGIILYVGFFAAGVIPAAQGLSTVFHGLSLNSSILILSIPSLILAILGYDLIHHWQRAGTFCFLAGFIILTVALFVHGGLDWAPGSFAGGPFLLSVSIIAVFQISYAPYVSDYSRYLREDIGISAPFWTTFIGTNLSALWLMIVACMVTAIYPKLGTVAGINAVIGGAAGVIVLLTVAFGIIGVNAMNLYGGMLSLVTALSSGRSIAPSAILRTVLVAVIFVASLLLAVIGAGNFMTNYENYLLLLLYLFIPWTAINLTDYYFVKKGSYDIDAFYDPHGIYGHDPATHIVGGVSLTAMAAYVIGFCVQLPFMNTTVYRGFMVRHLNGADISWIIGLIVSAAVYYYLVRGTVRRAAAQPASSAMVK